MKNTLVLIIAFYSSVVFAQTTVIPDPKFEQILVDRGIDSDGQVNGQVLTTDIETIQALNLNAKDLPENEKITSLQGIEDFAALKHLDCSYNNIASLDLTKNTVLLSLHCEDNSMVSLKVNGLAQLTLLYCQNNLFVSWDPVTGEGTFYMLNLDQCPVLSMMNASNCPNLLCIQVADAAAAYASVGIYSNWIKTPTSNYTECCTCMYPGMFSGQ